MNSRQVDLERPPNPAFQVYIRPARADDVDSIVQLSRPFVDEGLLRHRSAKVLSESVRDFQVAVANDLVVACIALGSCEGAARILYNFAVAQSHQRRGLGGRMLIAVIEMATQDAARVIYTATTRTDGWFNHHAFQVTTMDAVPKAWMSSLDPARGSTLLVRDLSAHEVPELADAHQQLVIPMGYV